MILGAFLYLVWPNIEILFPGETTKTLSFNDHIFLVIANGLLTFYFVIDALLEVKPMPRKILWLVLLTMFNLIVNPIYWVSVRSPPSLHSQLNLFQLYVGVV